MKTNRLRLMGNRAARTKVAGITVTYQSAAIANGAAEGQILGPIIVGGWTGPYTIVRTDGFGALAKIDGNIVKVGATPTSGQSSFTVAGYVDFGGGITKAFSGETIVISPALETVPIGNTPYGSWAGTDLAALGIAAHQGTAPQYGYDQRACGGWTTGMYDKVTGVHYVGLLAGKGPTLAHANAGFLNGIKEVWFGANNPATWLKVTAESFHPTLNNKCYVAPVSSITAPRSERIEMRAIVIPYVGKPFVLEGILDSRDTTWNGDRRLNWSDDMWSMLLTIDKTGNDFSHADVYINTNTGNDANSGLNASVPVKTGERAIAVLQAAVGSSDVGGCNIYHTAGLGQTFGRSNIIMSTDNTVTQPVIPAYAWLRIRPAPGVDPSLISITASTPYGYFVEKVSFELNKTCPIGNNCPGDAWKTTTVANNYGALRFTNGTHDGGPAVDSNGQSAGAALFTGQPDGYNELINYPVTRCANPGLVKSTLVINSPISHISPNKDVANNPKVWVASDISYGVHIGKNHLDGIQFFRSGFVGAKISMCLLDSTKIDNFDAQALIIADGELIDFYMRDLDFNGGEKSIIIGKCRNFYFQNPRFIQNMNIWDEHLDPDNVDVRVTYLDTSLASDFLTKRCFGVSVIKPNVSPVEPDVLYPTFDSVTSRFAANIPLEFNLNYKSTVLLDFPETTWKKTITHVRAAAADSVALRFISVGTRPIPTWDTSKHVPLLQMNGDNTTSSSGTALQGTSPSSVNNNNPCEIFMILDNNETNPTYSRIFMSYGSTSRFTARTLYRVISGGQAYLQWQIGQGSSTASSINSPNPVPAGLIVAHVWYNPANLEIGVGLYDSTHRLYNPANYAVATATGPATTSGTRLTFGGSTTTPGGSNSLNAGGGLARVGWNRMTFVNRICTSEERAQTIADLLTQAGL